MKLGIVLSGGGAKGAYQLGFWKAIRKMKIKYDIVTGTSVGALNGALMVQNSYYKTNKVWKNMSPEMVLGKEVIGLSKYELIKKYSKQLFKGGLEIIALENLLKKNVNLKKIYSSKIDFGIVTVKSSKLKPFELTKSQIPKEKFIDYIIASASCFPAFKKKKIDNENYIDGGFYDNLPINLAIKMGSDTIIAVDLNEIGINKKVNNSKIPIKYITLKNNTGLFLDFNKIMSKNLINYGYNDTMKAFNKLEGNLFTFKKNELHKNYIKINQKIQNQGIYIEQNKMNSIIEELGQTLLIDQTLIYTIYKFNNIIKSKYKNNSKILYYYNKYEKLNKKSKYYLIITYLKSI